MKREAALQPHHLARLNASLNPISVQKEQEEKEGIIVRKEDMNKIKHDNKVRQFVLYKFKK